MYGNISVTWIYKASIKYAKLRRKKGYYNCGKKGYYNCEFLPPKFDKGTVLLLSPVVMIFEMWDCVPFSRSRKEIYLFKNLAI